jgi:hypothetical protein
MNGADMNDPHVEKLYYRVIIPEDVDYEKANLLSGETDDFSLYLSKNQLIVEMKTHCASEVEARGIVDDYLKGWEVTAGLLNGPDSLTFKFSTSIILDRTPGNENIRNAELNVSSTEVIVLSDEIEVHVSHAEFPAPPQQFRTSPEVEMMYLRYKLYREGRESLLGMAYWCLTVIEYSARGRTEAADQYRVDLKVLRRLGELCGNRGGINEARKLNGQAGVTPLKPEEREWIKTVIKTLILRVGEYAFNPIAKLTQITMSDFPSTK